MRRFDNHNNAVYNQAGVQNFRGDVTFNCSTASADRLQLEQDDASNKKLLDREILASLAFPEMLDLINGAQRATRHTCEWIFELEEYKLWKARPSGLLRIKGKHGSGKSTLMSHMYHSIAKERQVKNEVIIGFFFSGSGTVLERTSLGMCRALLNQLFYHAPAIREITRAAYTHNMGFFGNRGRQWEWKPAELEILLRDSLLSCASRYQVTVFVDAIEEAERPQDAAVIHYLHDINVQVRQLGGAVRICIACRHYPILSDIKATEIYMEHHNTADIKTHVMEYLKKVNTIHLRDRQDLTEIIHAVVNMANGVFQWVSLVTPKVARWLRHCDSVEDIMKNLSAVPEELSAMYEHIICHDIERKDLKKTLRLFQWACLARVPLSVTGMRYALSADDTVAESVFTRCHKLPDFVNSDEEMNIHINCWSGGLLEVRIRQSILPHRSAETVVQFTHQSVMDFMLDRGLALLMTSISQPAFDRSLNQVASNTIQTSHEILYLACLKYLATEAPMENFWDDIEHNADDSALPFLEHWPFETYAATYCFEHATECAVTRKRDLEEESRLIHLSGPRLILSRHQQTMIDYLGIPNQHGIPESPVDHDLLGIPDHHRNPVRPSRPTVLHVAVDKQLMYLIDYRIKCKDDVDAPDEIGWTPLHTAVFLGSLELVRVLHGAGADIQRFTESRDTALMLAVRSEIEDIFSFLWSQGADMEARNESSETVLHLATSQGSIAMFQLCVTARPDVNARNAKGETALHIAALRGEVSMVRSLIDAGIDVNVRNAEGETALHIAASRCANPMVESLIDAGTDVNAVSKNKDTALILAVLARGVNTVSMLLEAGADVNKVDRFSRTALQIAIILCSTEITQLLLEAGAKDDVYLPLVRSDK